MKGMKNIVLLIVCLPLLAGAQALSSLNLASWYNPLEEISFTLKPVILEANAMVFFEMQVQKVGASLADYSVTWERRSSYDAKDGETISPAIDTLTARPALKGRLAFPKPETDWFLLAKVKNNSSQQEWYFFVKLESKYPVNGYLTAENGPVLNGYVFMGKEYQVVGSGSNKPIKIYFYKDQFPAGSPPFAERDMAVDRFLFADSTFTVEPDSKISFKREGLYLAQEDTAAARGFAFRTVSESYPRYTKMDDLTEPLVFVTTQTEYNELLAANNEKPKFDKVILDITRDKDRATNFMRSYFRRVELANKYFTSYKEGWRTDRGMIYLIYGLPTEVSRNNGRETWYYKTFGLRLTFVKTGSVYDPETYVLVRDKRYMEKWYSTIDLWRKSRY